MKKFIVFMSFIVSSLTIVCAQADFEKGYFVDESNQRIDCFIRNLDWRNNPTKFDYKLSMEAPVQEASILTVREFGIVGVSKFVRNTVDIDRSSIDIQLLSSMRNPEFQEEQLFLKVLVEGQASLFMFVDGNLTRFFYKTTDSAVKQLIYKQYKVNGKIGHNNYFRQQLLEQLICPSISLSAFKNINYRQRDLADLFVKYNECVNAQYVYYEPIKRDRDINLSIRAGVSYSDLFVENKGIEKEFDFGSQFGFRFGVEAEFMLPFSTNKWSFILEPTYRHYDSSWSEETSSTFRDEIKAIVKYNSIDLPLGFRRYFLMNEEFEFFAGASYVLSFDVNSSLKYSTTSDYSEIYNSVKINPRRNLAFGVGCKYLDKYSVEARYSTGREILGDYLYWRSSFKAFSVVFGYSIF